MYKKIFIAMCITFTGFVLGAVAPAVMAAEAPPEEVQLVNPIGGSEKNPKGEMDIPTIVGNAINIVMGILGSIALLIFVYGGFMWLLSGGNAEKVKTGTNAMVWSAVGIFIIFSSYAIISLVIKGLSGA